MYREKGDHIITCVTEHKAILDTCKHLEKDGFRVTFLPVDSKGFVRLDDIQLAGANSFGLLAVNRSSDLCVLST